MKDQYFSDQLYHERPAESLICVFGSLAKKYGGVNFAQGIPGFQPPKELLDILSSLVYKDFHQYAPGHGNAKLLKQIVSHHHDDLPNITEDNVLIVQGATEAGSLIYNYLSAEINEPFSAMAFDPVYETFSHLPKIFGSDFVPFYPGNHGIDFTKLEQSVRRHNVRVLFLNSPGNPLGTLLSKDDYLKIIALSRKYNIYILMDAVYKDLYFHDPPYIPVEHTGENLFYINSFSKMLSITGWRIGYFITSSKHMNKIKQIHDYTGLCAPSIFQEAIAQYLHKFNYGVDYLNKTRDILYKNYLLLKEYLVQKRFAIPDIQGGYFIWAKIPDGLPDGYKLALDLYREQQVAVVPGEHFSDQGERYLRFNIARNTEEIESALPKLDLFFQKYGL